MGATSRSACPQGRRQREPIDRGFLQRFTRGNLALEREVLALFAAELSRNLDRLNAAVDAGEWKAIAHTIKGSAGAIGAFDLARAAERAELIDVGEAMLRKGAIGAIGAAAGEVSREIARLTCCGALGT